MTLISSHSMDFFIAEVLIPSHRSNLLPSTDVIPSHSLSYKRSFKVMWYGSWELTCSFIGPKSNQLESEVEKKHLKSFLSFGVYRWNDMKSYN